MLSLMEEGESGCGWIFDCQLITRYLLQVTCSEETNLTSGTIRV